MRISVRSALLFSGLTWFGIGFFLLTKGLQFIVLSVAMKGTAPLTSLLGEIVQREQVAVILISASLLLGAIKGRFVLQKKAKKLSDRLLSQETVTLKTLYPRSYYILLAGMMALGMSLNVFSVPLDIRGVVDAAIGTALISGSLAYFRNAIRQKLSC